MQIISATAQHAASIAEIYNHAVVHTTAIWNDTQVNTANRVAWIAARQALGYPVLVAVKDEQVLGYTSFGDFRAFEGYRFTAEHSVYVHPDARRQGIATSLLTACVAEARRLGKHVLIGAIEAGNLGSITLHQQMGFVETGRLQQVGFKFGRWLDLSLMQLVLK
jgi:L-amino acid N-acyltransferase